VFIYITPPPPPQQHNNTTPTQQPIIIISLSLIHSFIHRFHNNYILSHPPQPNLGGVVEVVVGDNNYYDSDTYSKRTVEVYNIIFNIIQTLLNQSHHVCL
jgi:hypothetical protein